MKKYLTTIAVIIFVVVFGLATYNAHAETGPRISLGYTLFNSHQSFGEVGYEFDDIEISASKHGADAEDGLVDIYSISHKVRPDWQFLGATNYYRLGVAHVDGSDLVGEINYRLGVGLEWRFFALEYFHYSSADINPVNTGIDGVQLSYKVPVEFKF